MVTKFFFTTTEDIKTVMSSKSENRYIFISREQSCYLKSGQMKEQTNSLPRLGGSVQF